MENWKRFSTLTRVKYSVFLLSYFLCTIYFYFLKILFIKYSKGYLPCTLVFLKKLLNPNLSKYEAVYLIHSIKKAWNKKVTVHFVENFSRDMDEGDRAVKVR